MRKCMFCKVKPGKIKNVSFFRFPKDKTILELWIKNMNFDPNWVPAGHHYLCSQHFSTQCLDLRHHRLCNEKLPNQCLEWRGCGLRLRRGSIPTIFGINNENPIVNYRQILNAQNQQNINPLKETRKLEAVENILPGLPIASEKNLKNDLPNELTPTETTASAPIIDHDHAYAETPEVLKKNLMEAKIKIHQLTTKNHSLIKRQKRLVKKVITMRELLKTLKKKAYLKDKELQFLRELKNIPAELFSRMYKKNSRTKISSDKYPPNLRCFALTLHFYSPKAYNYVRENFECVLPHPSVLRSWYKTIKTETGAVTDVSQISKNSMCVTGK